MSEHVCELPIDGMCSFVSGSTTIPVREQIVRCKDCEYYVPEFGYSEERGFGQIEHLIEPPACARHKGFEITVEPDGFCAWGHRR